MIGLASLSLLAPLLLSTSVYAAKADIGGYCEYSAVHMDVATLALNSGCVATAYCSANNICVAKGCRRDEFPYGYGENDTLPMRCGEGYVCPDEMDQCQAQVGPGETCQLDRDDECAPPSNYLELKSSLNVNGSICLNQVCHYDNRTIGEACELENLVFVGWDANGNEFPDIRSRDNCKFGAYCDGTSKLCIATKNVKDACSADKECSSYNCATTGFCVAPSFSPRTPAVWIYVVVALFIALIIIGTGVGLFFIHKRSREEYQVKLEQYYTEQTAYRQSLFTLSNTRDSLMRLPKNTTPDVARQSLLVNSYEGGGTSPREAAHYKS